MLWAGSLFLKLFNLTSNMSFRKFALTTWLGVWNVIGVGRSRRPWSRARRPTSSRWCSTKAKQGLRGLLHTASPPAPTSATPIASPTAPPTASTPRPRRRPHSRARFWRGESPLRTRTLAPSLPCPSRPLARRRLWPPALHPPAANGRNVRTFRWPRAGSSGMWTLRPAFSAGATLLRPMPPPPPPPPPRPLAPQTRTLLRATRPTWLYERRTKAVP